MAKRVYYDDIIISEVISTEGKIKTNRVVDIARNIEQKEAASIVKVLRRVLSPKYYVSELSPGQYEVGSIYHSRA